MDILYDCYDKEEKHIGIIFAKDCSDLLRKNSEVKYVRGMDAVTRKQNWFEVKETGLWPCTPQNNVLKKMCERTYLL